MSTFEAFNRGKLWIKSQLIDLSSIPWSKHPCFKGVELKNLITAEQTQNVFSYHLVRIAPEHKIGLHEHEQQTETHEIIAGSGYCIVQANKLIYKPGTISVLPSGVLHEVIASKEGLYLFAKFFTTLN